MDVLSFSIFIGKEDERFVASCPMLDIASQGKTEEEVKENMKELIEEYMKADKYPSALAAQSHRNS